MGCSVTLARAAVGCVLGGAAQAGPRGSISKKLHQARTGQVSLKIIRINKSNVREKKD